MSSIISESFDDAQLLDLRLMHEASRLGALTVYLWTDEMHERVHGRPPKFPYAEREYFVSSMRFVTRVVEAGGALDPVAAPEGEGTWFFRTDSPLASARLAAAGRVGRAARALRPDVELAGTPANDLTPSDRMWTVSSPNRKVVVTGCYDYFHSGHVRFFEECAELGDLYVCVGNDANVKALKGPRNPLFPDTQRRYITGCCRFVRQSLTSTGSGWMDAAPNFAEIRPDIYAVNEDGDKPEKAAWCSANGVEYRVLRRLPKPGLPRRTSTDMRGF